jgi:hypothetical protein
LRRALILAAATIAAAGALVHLAIPLGGPSWYAFFGAPRRLVVLAQAGAFYPAIACGVIAALLGLLSAYAFSAARLLPPLPLRRWVLGVAGVGLVARALLFVPLALWQPGLLAGLCGACGRVDAFVLATSALCLATGVGFLIAGLERHSANAA